MCLCLLRSSSFAVASVRAAAAAANNGGSGLHQFFVRLLSSDQQQERKRGLFYQKEAHVPSFGGTLVRSCRVTRNGSLFRAQACYSIIYIYSIIIFYTTTVLFSFSQTTFTIQCTPVITANIIMYNVSILYSILYSKYWLLILMYSFSF